MTNNGLLIVFGVVALMNLIGVVLLSVRASFYRAYFFQKQVNMGRDPRTVLRGEFPSWIARLM